MSRKRETQDERLARWEAESAEQARLEARSMWEKIDDAKDIYDIKEILWEITRDQD